VSWTIGSVSLPHPPQRVTQTYKRAVKTLKVILGKPILMDWGRDVTTLKLEGYCDKTTAESLRDTLLSSTQPVYLDCPEGYSGYYVPQTIEIRQEKGYTTVYRYTLTLIRVDSDFATYIQVST